MTRRQAGDFSEAWVDNRKSCDFSPSPKRYQQLPPPSRPLAPTKGNQVSYRPGGGGGGAETDLLRGRLQLHPYPPPQPQGLGRRAVTQLDFGRTQRAAASRETNLAAQRFFLLQQQQQHGGSQYLNKRGGHAVAEAASAAPPYASDSEFTAQRARRPHVLLHKEQPVLTRIRRPSQVREGESWID